MQDIQNIPNPDGDTPDVDPHPLQDDIEQPNPDIPVPPDSEPQTPVEEPPDVEGNPKPPVREDNTNPPMLV